jgi:cytochrome o ubiquinol oxidase subunit III
MTTQVLDAHDHHHDHHIEHSLKADSNDVFGFWLYIMTDCILFATLFATFAVLHNGGPFSPPLKDLVSLPYVLKETFFLLASNLTFGLAVISLNRRNVKRVTAPILWLLVTIILGACFVFMEVNEFAHLIHEGYSYQTSGALSSFFVLVGTHGLHVSVGILWIFIMAVQLGVFGINSTTKRRITYLGLFWNFLEIVWIFVFTIVYLMSFV